MNGGQPSLSQPPENRCNAQALTRIRSESDGQSQATANATGGVRPMKRLLVCFGVLIAASAKSPLRLGNRAVNDRQADYIREAQADQVVRGRGEEELPVHAGASPVAQLAETADGLQPA